MGCWSVTCMISNLPINEGDKVKLIFLKSKKIDLSCTSGICYPSDIFSPAFLPIEGQYKK